MRVIIGVRFRKPGKVYFFDPGYLHINIKTKVIVETALGEEIGEVVAKKKILPDMQFNTPLRKIVRIANYKDIKHHDENKKKVEYTIEKNVIKKDLNFKTISNMEEALKSIKGNIDIQKTAEDWSLYLTDDLDGNLHGFYNINKYLIKDSDIYKNAYKWATGIDISYVSSHVLSNPTFINERIENFEIYNENAFSCEVYLQKNLKLTNANKKIEDIMHERMYFAYYQTQDNIGEWKLVNMQSITDN